MNKSGFFHWLLFFIVSSTLSSDVAHGQGSLDLQKDSLLLLVDKASSNRAKVDLYNEIGKLYRGDSIQAIKYADIAFDLAEDDDYLEGKVNSILIKAFVFYDQTSHEKLYEELDKGFKLIEQTPDSNNQKIKKSKAKLLELKGLIEILDKEYYASIETLNAALEITNELDDDINTSILLLNISYVYGLVGDYTLSNEILTKAIPYHIKSKSHSLLIVSYNNIGDNYINKKEYTKALAEYELALKISEENNIYKNLGTLKYSTGFCLMELGSEEEALVNFKKARTIYEEEKNENYAAYCRLFIAKIRFAKSKNQALLLEYKYAYEVGEKYQDLELQKYSASALADAQSNLGNYKEAYTQFKLAKILQDSLTDNELLLKLRNLAAKNDFEMDKKKIEAQIAQEIADTKLEHQSKIIFLLIGLISIALISGFLIYRAYKTSSKAKKDLLEKNVALQKAEALLSESNEEMQNYIDLNVELEQFAYIASHDIKAPLRTIKGFVGLLKKKFYHNAEDNYKSYFDFVENGTNSLNLLVNDLLEYSKLDF